MDVNAYEVGKKIMEPTGMDDVRFQFFRMRVAR